MARYNESVCRLCRRETMKLYLKGDRCYSDKCAVERRNYPPGQHGQGRSKFSDYGLQLREKQKIKRMYGLVEKQFKTYFKHADRQKGVTGTNFLILPAALISSIFGMNALSMPIVGTPHDFWKILFLMFCAVVFTVLFFRRKKLL